MSALLDARRLLAFALHVGQSPVAPGPSWASNPNVLGSYSLVIYLGAGDCMVFLLVISKKSLSPHQ